MDFRPIIIPSGSGTPTRQDVQNAIDQGDLVTARTLATQSAEKLPMQMWPHNILAFIAYSLGDHAAASHHMGIVCEMLPGDAKMRVNYARTLHLATKFDEAHAQLDIAQRINPDMVESYVLRAELYSWRNLYMASLAAASLAAAKFPTSSDVKFVLAEAQANTMRASEAVATLDNVMRERPGDINDAATAAAFTNYQTGEYASAPGQVPSIQELLPDPVASFEAHKVSARMVERYNFTEEVKLSDDTNRMQGIKATRGMRIGVMSPDLRDHSVAMFIEPVMKQLHGMGVEVYAYFTGTREDAVTQRFKGYVAGWRSIAQLGRSGLARAAGADTLDVLIELGGLFSGHAVDILMQRPARKMISYLGYPNTTGLSCVDARIVDSITDSDSAQDVCKERLYHLDPCFVCFGAPEYAPPVAAAPYESNNYITFCSFNNIRKINQPLLALWAGVLRNVPDSRLLLKAAGLGEELMQAQIISEFTRAGVDAARIEMVGYASSPADHLGTYARADIALDTVPYNGTTTTCEAAWMGVPTVTLLGNAHRSRVGASLMSSLGLERLVAKDTNSYITIAKELSSDRAGLSTMRARMRAKMSASPLMDAAGFTNRFLRVLGDIAGIPFDS